MSTISPTTGLTADATIGDYFMIALIVIPCATISIIISLIVMLIIWRTKPRLHTSNHLLICNTCIISIVYCLATIFQYIYLLFIKWDTSNTTCQWRAYFFYVGTAGLLYSYTIQAISRLFFSVLAIKYPRLRTFKTHYILISIQWLVVALLASPSLITKDIYFRYEKLCFVPVTSLLHSAWIAVTYYIIPVCIIIIIYIYIYRQVKNTRRNAVTLTMPINNHRRDLKVLQNIMILISFIVGGGSPTMIYFLTPTKYPYMTCLITSSIADTLAKLCTIILDRRDS